MKKTAFAKNSADLHFIYGISFTCKRQYECFVVGSRLDNRHNHSVCNRISFCLYSQLPLQIFSTQKVFRSDGAKAEIPY